MSDKFTRNDENVLVEAFAKVTPNVIEEAAKSVTLEKISIGEHTSDRHEVYQDVKTRKTLADVELLSLLNLDDLILLENNLKEKYSLKKPKPYIEKVLVPEAIVSLFAICGGIPRIEAEKFLGKYVQQMDNKGHFDGEKDPIENVEYNSFKELVKIITVADSKRNDDFHKKIAAKKQAWKRKNNEGGVKPGHVKDTCNTYPRRQKKGETPVESAKLWCKLKKDQPYLNKYFVNEKIGYGVFTEKVFGKGTFLMEYEGNLLKSEEGESLEEKYQKEQLGSFIYYFNHLNETLCIDATYSKQLGKFVNDGVKGNCIMKKEVFDDKPHLCLYATRDIPYGEELRYDYGDTTLWWRKHKDCKNPYRFSDLSPSLFDVQGESISTIRRAEIAYERQYEEMHNEINVETEVFKKNCSVCYTGIKVGKRCQLNSCGDRDSEYCIFCFPEHVCVKLLEELHEESQQQSEDENNIDFSKSDTLIDKDIAITYVGQSHVEKEDTLLKGNEDAVLKENKDTVLKENEDDVLKEVSKKKEVQPSEPNVEICCYCKEISQCLTPCSIKDCVAFMKAFCPRCIDEHLCRRRVTNSELLLCSECSTEKDSTKFDRCRIPSCLKCNIEVCVECMDGHVCTCVADSIDGAKEYENAEKREKITKRRQVKCPLSYCTSISTDLSRHLRQVHKWPKEKAKGAMATFALRKQYQKKIKSADSKSKIVKDYHKHRLCPVGLCESVVKRLDEHLRKSHKLHPSSEKYKMYLKGARVTQPGFAGKNKITDTYYNKYEEKMPSIDLEASSNNSNESVHDFADRYEEREPDPSQPSEPSEASDPTYCPDSGYEAGMILLDEKTESFIKKFYDYLTSPDGGYRDKVSISKECGELRRIYRSMSAKSLEDFLNKDKINQDYLNKYCRSKAYKPDTVRKYLGSYADFCRFLIATEVQVANISINSLKQKVELWSKTYRKSAKESFHERAEEDYEMIITSNQVSYYEASECARGAIKLFGLFVSPYCTHMVSMKEYCMMRDHLLFKIHFSTACRSGVSSNMTVKEYAQARRQDDGTYIIKVRNHKTFWCYGYANVVLEGHVYGWLQTFVHKVRDQITAQCENVFLTWTGNRMSSGAISRQLHELFVKARLIKDDMPKRISCNVIRKSASSGIREEGLGFEQETADIMAHSLKTADKHYDVRRKEKSAVLGGRVIRSYFNTEKKWSEQILEEKPKIEKKVWTKEEEDVLKEVFVSEIASQTVTIDIIREKFFTLKFKNCSEKQLYDKVRSMYRFGKKVDDDHSDRDESEDNRELEPSSTSEGAANEGPTQEFGMLGNDACSDIIPPSSKMQRRCLFSMTELLILQKKCKWLIHSGSINLENVKKCLHGTDLLQKYTFPQIRTRLTYERTKAKKRQK